MATDTNRTGLAYIAESSWGETPSSNLTDLRFTGESFAFNISNVQSTEIRNDRQVTDIIQTGADCSGGFNFELSYSEYDTLLAAALWSSGWSTASTISRTNIAFNATSGRISSTGGFSALTTGQWIKVTGSSTAANNRFYRITSTGTTGIAVAPAPSATLSTADTVVIAGSYIRNGVTEKSFTFERAHEDAGQYFDFAGMVANTLNLSISADHILTGDFGFIGKSATLAQTSGGTGAYTAAGTNPVMNASSNVGEIFMGQFSSLATKDTDLYISEISFALNNSLRGLRSIGSIANCDIGSGTCEVTGSLNAYFLDNTLYDKYLAGTPTGLSFSVEDQDGNAYIFTFPAIEIESDAINSGGQNADVMENISWRAKRDPNTNCQIQICRFSA
jgi:hypothetical protein